jgi:hypothetical protein
MIVTQEPIEEGGVSLQNELIDSSLVQEIFSVRQAANNLLI